MQDCTGETELTSVFRIGSVRAALGAAGSGLGAEVVVARGAVAASGAEVAAEDEGAADEEEEEGGVEEGVEEEGGPDGTEGEGVG